jgi:hypothetical protein
MAFVKVKIARKPASMDIKMVPFTLTARIAPISLGQQVDLSNRSFSLSLWAKAEETGRNNAMIWQGPASIVAERFLFGLNSANQFVCGFGGTDLISAEQYEDTDWHQWTCTFDQSSGERVIYRDGQEMGRDTASPIPAMNENLFIGSAPLVVSSVT